MKKAAIVCALLCGGALLFNACIDKDLYKPQQVPSEESQENLEETEQSGLEYASRFENFGYYEAEITSEYAGGRYYAIFTDYPYSEEEYVNEDGDVTVVRNLVMQPVLSGLTPIKGTFAVPNGTEYLYVVNDDGCNRYEVGNLKLNDGSAAQKAPTRAATRTDDGTISDDEFLALKRYIDNQMLPEAKYNIRGENLYKCTDLVATEENQIVTVWVSLVRDNDVPGPVWYYIYTGTEPTADDCQFYGQNSKGEAVPMTWAEIKSGQKNWVLNKATGTNKEVQLAHQLVKGEKLGFVYCGNIGWRFTTPSLNTPENTKHAKYRAHETTGCKVQYEAPDSFELTRRVLGGAFMHFTLPYNGQDYNVVGFENRLPGEKTTTDGKNNGNYDGDYNDMVFLVRSNPQEIKPEEALPEPELKFTTARTGVWIFEDNYPDHGDFDFNDVVMYYEIKTCEGMMTVTCWLAAHGCSFNDEVGVMLLPNTGKDAWKNPTYKLPYFTVRGNKNVGRESVDLRSLRCHKETFVCNDFKRIRPYLDNGKGTCTFEVYNTGEYPYAMDIPAYIGATRYNDVFCWPQEQQSIDAAYYFSKNKKGGARSSDWYKSSQIKDASKVVNIVSPFFQATK